MKLNVVIVLVGLMSAVLLGVAGPAFSQEVHVVEITPKGPPSDDGELHRRVEALRVTLKDASARFSASAAVAEARTLVSYTDGKPQLLADRRTALRVIGAIAYRAPLMGPEEGIGPFKEALSITVDPQPEKRDLVFDHYMLASMASDAGQYDLAAEHYAKAIELSAGTQALTPDQRAGLMEKQGYVLQEAGRSEEALAVNRKVLAAGEEMFGPQSDRLTTVLTNMAQNLYDLKRLEEVEPVLIRCETIAEAAGDVEKQQDMLFQRGVLAFEQGRIEDARVHMKKRIAVIEASDLENREALLAEAHEAYDVLEEKIAEQ